MSGLKLIFHLKTQLLIFSKSPFKSITDWVDIMYNQKSEV